MRQDKWLEILQEVSIQDLKDYPIYLDCLEDKIGFLESWMNCYLGKIQKIIKKRNLYWIINQWKDKFIKDLLIEIYDRKILLPLKISDLKNDCVNEKEEMMFLLLVILRLRLVFLWLDG